RGQFEQLVRWPADRTDLAAPVRPGTEEEPVRDGEAEVRGDLPPLAVGEQVGGGRYRYQGLSTVDILAPGAVGEEVRHRIPRRRRDAQRHDRQQRDGDPGVPE